MQNRKRGMRKSKILPVKSLSCPPLKTAERCHSKFVVEKVKAILSMHLEIHEGWLRLYATINYSGIYADLAVNLGVVHAQFDRYRQRFVFQQLTDTDVIALYSDSYLKSKAIHAALWF